MRAAIIEAGVVSNIIEVERLEDWPDAVDAGPAGPGWTYVDGVFSPPASPPAPEQVYTMTPLTFIARLTPEEQHAIVSAAQNSPDIMLWLLQLMGAQEVDVRDTRTIAGVDAMIGAGLLSADHRETLLAAVAPT
jgi:hypothetical protein